MAKDSFKEIIKEGVQEALAEQEFTQETETTTEEDKELKEQKDFVESILSTLPKTSDYYLKLYKTSPLPPGVKNQFKTEIMNLAEIDDLEIYIRDLVKQNDWGPGEYMVMLFGIDPKTGRKLPGWRRRPIKFYIDYERKPETKTESFKDKFNEVKDIFIATKEVIGQPQPIVNPAEIGRTLAETLKTGVEIASQTKSKDNGFDPIRLIELIEKIKKTDERKEPSLVEILTVLKELGVFSREEKHDVWQEIARMKELGLLQLGIEKKEEDILDTVNKLRSLIEVVRPLIAPEPEGKASLGVEIIRTIGPHIPEVVKNVTETINNVAEVAKISRGFAVRPPQIPQTPAQAQPLPQTQRVVVNPLWLQFQNAIETDDPNLFQKVKEIIILYFGPHVIEYLVTGAVSVDTFLDSVIPYIGEVAKSEKSKSYLTKFIQWEVNNRKSLSVTARCQKCGELWEFDTVDDFEKSKLCECGGNLELEKQ